MSSSLFSSHSSSHLTPTPPFLSTASTISISTSVCSCALSSSAALHPVLASPHHNDTPKKAEKDPPSPLFLLSNRHLPDISNTRRLDRDPTCTLGPCFGELRANMIDYGPLHPFELSTHSKTIPRLTRLLGTVRNKALYPWGPYSSQPCFRADWKRPLLTRHIFGIQFILSALGCAHTRTICCFSLCWSDWSWE